MGLVELSEDNGNSLWSDSESRLEQNQGTISDPGSAAESDG